jgi:hypothetical protein
LPAEHGVRARLGVFRSIRGEKIRCLPAVAHRRHLAAGPPHARIRAWRYWDLRDARKFPQLSSCIAERRVDLNGVLILDARFGKFLFG